MATGKRPLLAKEEPEAEDLNLIKVLPFVLAVQDGKLLSCVEKHKLRLTCKTAKALVNPTLDRVRLNGNTILYNYENNHFNALIRSDLLLAAKSVTCEDITHHCMARFFSRVQFRQLECVCLKAIDEEAVHLVCEQNWPTLKSLSLTVYWNCDRFSPSQVNEIWKNFSKAKWPLLERISILVRARSDRDDSDESEISGDYELPVPGVGELVCLLKYFPNLKCLEFENHMAPLDAKAIASIPHNKLESVELGFARDDANNSSRGAALAEAQWPNLQNATLNGLKGISVADMRAFSKAPWLLNLKRLRLFDCILDSEVEKELLNKLQFGPIEALNVDGFGSNVFLAFNDANFKNLKDLSVTLNSNRYYAAGNVGDRNGEFNIAFSSLFSSVKLPQLESLCVGHRYYYRQDFRWDKAPDVTGEAVLSILPSLKSLKIIGMRIKKDCAKFLGSFYVRGGCEIDLVSCNVESDLYQQPSPLSEILKVFNLSKEAFEEELKRLGLYKKACWFNQVSIGALKSVVASLYLSKLTTHLTTTFLPAVKFCLALKETDSTGEMQGVLLQKFNETLEALDSLSAVCVTARGDGASGSGGGGQ